MTAGSASAVVTITTAGTTYSSSTSGGATETITLGYNSQGNTVAVVGGTKTTGDVLTVTATNASLGGGSSNSSYTVLSGDNLVTIAAGLAAAINSNTNLQTLGVTATNTAAADLTWSTNFTASPSLPSGTSTATVSATDGANNTKTDLHQNHVNTPSSQTLTFDLNGNMTSDGINTYKWDAANRLIEIDYPGSNNYTQIYYASSGGRTKIIEVANNVTTSTKQFFAGEERDANGNVTKQFFGRGVVIAGTSYFYERDHLGSIRQLTDASGNVVSAYSFQPYGGKVTLAEAISSDFQYAGYYFHARSGLNLTPFRAYSPSQSSWLSRDPLSDFIGSSMYAYVENNPLGYKDPLGLAKDPCCALTPVQKFDLADRKIRESFHRAIAEFNLRVNLFGLNGTSWMLGLGQDYARPAMAGNIIDQLTKINVESERKKDKCLRQILTIHWPGMAGPDFEAKEIEVWWDVTTEGAWKTHPPKYNGDGIGLIYHFFDSESGLHY